jgi:hypothetical protein
VSVQHLGETYRRAFDARRPSEYGGGVCTVLVRRVNGTVELLFHADPRTGAVMTPAQAIEVAEALTVAAEDLTLHRRPGFEPG